MERIKLGSVLLEIQRCSARQRRQDCGGDIYLYRLETIAVAKRGDDLESMVTGSVGRRAVRGRLLLSDVSFVY